MANPISPPTNKPVRELRSKNHADGFYWELCSRESAVFQQNAPVKRGTKYSDLKGARQDVIDLHPTGLWFCEEIVPLRSSDVGNMPGDHFVVWVWSTDWAAQSSTNAGITYSGESTAHPIYARDYFIRRDAWEASQTIATLAALTALIGATITAPGTGYTWASGTITGGATLAAVCSGGAIIAWIVTKEGSAITSGGAITITGDGTGATATAVIQPASAVLVAQNKQELPADSNLSKEFVLVQRIYETLPGPWIYELRENELLGLIQLKKRTVAVTTPPQVGSVTATTRTVYKAREDSSVVAWEIVETNSDGTGSDGNPAYPIIPREPYEDDRGAIHGTEQLVVDTGQTSSLVESVGVVTKTTYEPYNQFLKKKVVETWATTGPLKNHSPFDDERGTVLGTSQLVINSGQQSSLAESGGTVTETTYEEFSKVQSRKIIRTWATVSAVRFNNPYEDERGAIVGASQLVYALDFPPSSLAETAGVVTKTIYEKFNPVQKRKVVETWATTGPYKNGADRDDKRGAVKTKRRLVANTEQTPTLVESPSGTMVLTNYAEYSEVQSWEVVETWALPALSLTSTTINKDGTVTLKVRVQMLTTDIASTHTFGVGTETTVTKEEITDIISWRVTETRAAPGTPIVASDLDTDGMVKTTTRTYLNLSAITTEETLSAGIWTRTSKEAVNELMGWKVVVTRAIPGNAIPERDADPLLGPVQVTRQLVAFTTQLASTTPTQSTTYKATGDSNLVAWEIVRRWSDGTGSDASNPPFPVFYGPHFDDPERGGVKTFSLIVRAVWTVTAAFVVSGGSGGANGSQVVTGTTGTGVPFQANVTISGGTIVSVDAIAVGGALTIKPTNPYAEPVTGAGLTGATLLLAIGTVQEGSLTVSGSTVMEVRYDPYDGNEFLLKLTAEQWTVPGPRVNKVTHPYGVNGRRVESSRFYSYAAYLAAGRTANGTPHPDFASALLVDEYFVGKENAVGNLIQIFDEIPSAANQQGLGYSVSFEDGDNDFPHLRWRYKATREGLTFPEFGSACPIAGYTSLVLAGLPETEPINDADFQVIVTREYEILPGKIITDSPRIDGDGAPRVETRQRVVNGTVSAGQTIVSGNRVDTREEAINGQSYVSLKIAETQFLPAYILTGERRSAEVRGRTVDVTRRKAEAGTLSAETGNGVIESEVRVLSFKVEERISQKVSSLPPDESWAFWDFVPLPNLIFDIVHTVYCNNSQFFSVVTNPELSGGASVLRKHRTTISYSNTYPNPDLSGSAFTVRDLRYAGKVISFSFANALNDAISHTLVNSIWDGVDACSWTEDYDFTASSPSATVFAAGAWYVREFKVEPWGVSGFRSVKTEFYSAAGNPSI